MHLTQKQRDQLWGEDLPYSQVRLTTETRILGDRVSRVFAVVEVDMNPLTYRTVKRHRDAFADDQRIQDLIDHAEYRGQAHGYISCAFTEELRGPDVLEAARDAARMSEATLIRMHEFVMDRLGTRKGYPPYCLI